MKLYRVSRKHHYKDLTKPCLEISEANFSYKEGVFQLLDRGSHILGMYDSVTDEEIDSEDRFDGLGRTPCQAVEKYIKGRQKTVGHWQEYIDEQKALQHHALNLVSEEEKEGFVLGESDFLEL